MKRADSIVVGLSFAVLSLFGMPSAGVAETTYTYSGLDYTTITRTGDTNSLFTSYTTSEHVTGSLVLAQPLAANLNAQVVGFDSFSFSDGALSLDSRDAGVGGQFEFSTDSLGKITQWVGVASSYAPIDGDPANGYLQYVIRVAQFYDSLPDNLQDQSSQFFCGDGSTDESCVPAASLTAATSGTGQWTLAPASGAPEPATWSVMLVGFAAVGFASRIRRRGPFATV
jgi:hypothetical protein